MVDSRSAKPSVLHSDAVLSVCLAKLLVCHAIVQKGCKPLLYNVIVYVDPMCFEPNLLIAV